MENQQHKLEKEVQWNAETTRTGNSHSDISKFYNPLYCITKNIIPKAVLGGEEDRFPYLIVITSTFQAIFTYDGVIHQYVLHM